MENKPVPELKPDEKAANETQEVKSIEDEPKTDVQKTNPNESPNINTKPLSENSTPEDEKKTSSNEEKPAEKEKEIKNDEKIVAQENVAEEKPKEIKDKPLTEKNGDKLPPAEEKSEEVKHEENIEVATSGDKVASVEEEIQPAQKANLVEPATDEKGSGKVEAEKSQSKVELKQQNETLIKVKHKDPSVNDKDGSSTVDPQKPDAEESKKSDAEEPQKPEQHLKGGANVDQLNENLDTSVETLPVVTQQKEKPNEPDVPAEPAVLIPIADEGELKTEVNSKPEENVVGKDEPTVSDVNVEEKEDNHSELKKQTTNEEEQTLETPDKLTTTPEAEAKKNEDEIPLEATQLDEPLDETLLPTQVEPVNEISEISPYSVKPSSVQPRSLPTNVITPNPLNSPVTDRRLDEPSQVMTPDQSVIREPKEQLDTTSLEKPVVPELKLGGLKEKKKSKKPSVKRSPSLSAEPSRKSTVSPDLREQKRVNKPMSPGPALAIQQSPSMTCTSARGSLGRSDMLFALDISEETLKFPEEKPRRYPAKLHISPTVAQHRATPDFTSIRMDSSVAPISYAPVLSPAEIAEKEALEKEQRDEAAVKIQSYYRAVEGRKVAKDEQKKRADAKAKLKEKMEKERATAIARRCETREMSSQTFLLSEHIKLRPGAKNILRAQLDLETVEVESTDTKFMMPSPKAELVHHKEREQQDYDGKRRTRGSPDSAAKRGEKRKIDKIIGDNRAKLKILFNQYKSSKSDTINLSSFIQMLKQKKVLRKLSQLPLVTKAFHTARGVHCADADLRLDFTDFCQALVKSGMLIYAKKDHKYPSPPAKVNALFRRLLRLIQVPGAQKSTPYIPIKSEQYTKPKPAKSRSRSRPREVDYHFSLDELDDEIGRLFADEKLLKKKQRKERQLKRQTDASVATSAKACRKTQAAPTPADNTKNRRQFRRYRQNESNNPNVNGRKRGDEGKVYSKTPSKPNPPSRRISDDGTSARKPHYKRRSRIKQKQAKAPKAKEAEVSNSANDHRAFQKERRENFNQQREEVSALRREKRELEAMQQAELKARTSVMENQISQSYQKQGSYLPEDKAKPIMFEPQMPAYYQGQHISYHAEEKPSPMEENQGYRPQPQQNPFYQSQLSHEVPPMLMPEPSWAPHPAQGYQKQELGGPAEMADKYSHYYPQEFYGQMQEPQYHQYPPPLQQIYSNMSPEFGQPPMQGHNPQPPHGYQSRAAPIQQQYGPMYHYAPQAYPQYGSGVGQQERGRLRQNHSEINVLQKRAQQVQNEELVHHKEREQQYMNQFDTRQRTVLERVSPKPTARHYKGKDDNNVARHR